MKIKLGHSYKSLSPFEWETDANLIIVTGTNGSGKTQLLELITKGIGPSQPENDIHQDHTGEDEFGNPIYLRYYLKVTGLNDSFREFVGWNSYGKDLWAYEIDYSYYQQFISWLFLSSRPPNQKLRQALNAISHEDFRASNIVPPPDFENLVNGKHLRDTIIEKVSERVGIDKLELEFKHFLCYLPLNFIFGESYFYSRDAIDYFTFFYYMQKAMRERYEVETDSLGKEPIAVLNEILRSCGLMYSALPFPYEPYKKARGLEIELKTIRPYKLLIKKDGSSNPITFQNLSSGERIIVSLGFLEYYANYWNKAPSTLILDELDAHLHPALLPNFFRVVNDVLIKKFNATVIMTTHDPSTIALAPKDNRCEVYRINNAGKTELIKDNSTNHYASINLLCEGLLTINEKTKFVFVEDEDDAAFYNNVNTVKKIEEKLVFVPASNRTKNEVGKDVINQTGGKNAVDNLLKRFDALQGVFGGLIDKDSGNENYANGIKILNRYSLENYYFDPLVLFSFLQSNPNRMQKEINTLNVIPGREYELKTDPKNAQSVIDFILSQLEPKVIDRLAKEIKKGIVCYSKNIERAEDSKTRVKVEFLDGISYCYPEWLLFYRGKTLNSIFNEVFGLHPDNSKLGRHFNAMGLYPAELVEKIRELI